MAYGPAVSVGRQYLDDPEVLLRLQQERMMRARAEGANPTMQTHSRSGATMPTPGQEVSSWGTGLAHLARIYGWGGANGGAR